MPLLLPTAQLQQRAGLAAAGDLRALADSLAAELDPLVRQPPTVPPGKAWLSRTGGRCPRDGALLDFDPYRAHDHRCPRCGATFQGDLHDRWWTTWRQLWLAERAVHGALLALVRPADAAAHGAVADALLAQYADAYLHYPNADNALGPTRPFFSTYLESIWLLQLATALDLREARAGGAGSLGAAVRDRLLEPSTRLVAGYDEGASNRQVWNNAALLAAGRLLGDDALVERAAFGPSGLVRHLADGLLADGSWYEGENYHLFAHRGLWYGVQLCEAAGIELPPALVRRFGEGFATPFLTALPDLTFPARRDSQHAVSIRQWRFAELAELGLARTEDARLAGALAALYDPAVPRRDPGRWRSTAEAERNEPASGLARADLGWRSLLAARATLPAAAPSPPGSVLLEGQGLAVFRRDAGRVYAALDYGHAGGGHGHPDRLNLLLAHGRTRWLDDMGTGSYVDPSLHWYRSTLAHNAPLVNGRSQARVHGVLASHDERPAAGWVDAVVHGAAPGVELRRALVVLEGYLVSELAWTGPADTVLDLPIHADGTVVGARWAAAPLPPGGPTGAEDGWPYVADAERATLAPDGTPHLAAVAGDARADVWMIAPEATELWRARSPGAPGRGEARFHLLRARGASGRITVVWSWRGELRAVARAVDAVGVELVDGTRHEHRRVGAGWSIGLHAAGARSSIDLAGARAVPPSTDPRPAPPDPAPRPLPMRATLGEAHYRRSEPTWAEAGAPTAEVIVRASDGHLVVDVRVRQRDAAPAPAVQENPLDNEHPDVNANGVQLHLAFPDGTSGAWLIAPDPTAPTVRVSRGSQHTAGDVAVEASWHPADGGYALRAAVPLAGRDAGPRVVRLDVLVNETAPDRARRRGQLVLSGGAGEFVYLRGDRHPPERLIPFAIDDV